MDARRNRQSYRPNSHRQQQRAPRGRGGDRSRAYPSAAAVPSAQQVVPGAAVSIVLKQDQPTGRQVRGVVQDVLTRGDHPRGIKVRLQDGRVGRVQQMLESASAATLATDSLPRNLSTGIASTSDAEERPAFRTLADFLPDLESNDQGSSEHATFTTATAKCPICGNFQGDEIAVSRHVDSHFT